MSEPTTIAPGRRGDWRATPLGAVTERHVARAAEALARSWRDRTISPRRP